MGERENGADRDGEIPVADAVDAVVAAGDDRDRADVRRSLDAVAEDGVVSGGGVRSALAHVSKVVSTPETRAELAAMELDDAREAAADVADVDAVGSRLDAFAARLADVESRVDDLGEALGSLVERAGDLDPAADPAAAHEVGREVRRLAAAADGVGRAADELAVDVEEFQRWVADPEVRADELEEDAEALAGALDDLSAGVDAVVAGVDGATDDGGGSVADGDGPAGDHGAGDGEVSAAVRWFDLALRRRVLSLLATDLRAELADCRTLAERGDGDADRLAAVESRLDDLRARLGTLDDRLDDISRPAWRDRFGDRLRDFETAIDAHGPPVEWAAVGETLEDHSPDVEWRD